MPVIVAPDAFNLWLDCAEVDAKIAAALITPAADELLERDQVSSAVNRAANDSAELIAPVPATASDTAAAAAEAGKGEKAERSAAIVLERATPL